MGIRSRVFAAMFAAGVALATAQPAAASVVLLENLTNINSGSVFDETRGAQSGILTRIEVGGSNVDIDGFGVFGRQVNSGSVKFAIFNQSGFNPVHVSGAVAAAAAQTLQWYDSPSFALTLLANNIYYFGLISDQSFVYHWATDVGPVTANGLTSPQSNVAGSNGNFTNFATPTMTDNCCFVQMSLRVTAAEQAPLPEPAALALLGLGLAGLGVLRRRRGR